MLMGEKEIKQTVGKAEPLVSMGHDQLRAALGSRSLVLVGLMGAGKSTIGKQLALMLGLEFFDADHEIEVAAQMSIADIFTLYGEQEFRQLEHRVILRLLQSTGASPDGGGAFMNSKTREAIASSAISIWLKADLDLLMARVSRKNTRPLLQNDNPRAVMRRLMNERYPVYELADMTVPSRDASREEVTADLLMILERFLKQAESES